MKLELLTCETVKVATSDAIISTSTSFDGTGGETGVGRLVGMAGRGGGGVDTEAVGGLIVAENSIALKSLNLCNAPFSS
jgi:hypothetical protein